MSPNPESSHSLVCRNRLHQAVGAVGVIGVGLILQSGVFPFPAVIAKYGGDALWAVVLYLAIGGLWNNRSIRWVALITLSGAWSVEFLQLYHAPGIDTIRATRLGHWVLGTRFNPPDLLAYVAGIGIAVLAETFKNRSLPPKTPPAVAPPINGPTPQPPAEPPEDWQH